jgi:hypothetical protein
VPSMPHPVQLIQNYSTTGEVVIGVDTRKDLHVAAVITALGALLRSTAFPGDVDWLRVRAGCCNSSRSGCWSPCWTVSSPITWAMDKHDPVGRNGGDSRNGVWSNTASRDRGQRQGSAGLRTGDNDVAGFATRYGPLICFPQTGLSTPGVPTRFQTKSPAR